MKMRLLVAVLLLLPVAGSDLLACGDKFLVISRGTRFQRATVDRPPAKILIFANPASNLPRALEKARAEETLSRAGYRPVSVSDAAALEQALTRDTWDLVIADLADGGAVRGRLQGRSGAPMVVPVLYRATGGELAEAKRDYLRVVKGPLKSQAFLEAIDDAVALREKLLQARTS